jgi:hypothetical protein
MGKYSFDSADPVRKPQRLSIAVIIAVGRDICSPITERNLI